MEVVVGSTVAGAVVAIGGKEKEIIIVPLASWHSKLHRFVQRLRAGVDC